MEESSRKLIHSVQKLLPEKGHFLLAFSGGSDSLALLFILSMVARDRTEALYINHRIRCEDELQAEIALNRHNAEKLGIPFSVIELGPDEVSNTASVDKCGVEAAARKLRYSSLEKYRKENGFDYILTAHHREDQVESIVMRLIDSAPFYSLSGIRMRDGNKLRPLLLTPKKEIMSLLADMGLAWSEDSTNRDDDYKRNSVRHNIIPIISERERELISKIGMNTASFIEKNGKPLDISYSYYAEFGREQFADVSELRAEATIYAINSYFRNNERVSRAFVSEIRRKAQEGTGRLLSPSMSFYFLKDVVRAYPAVWDFAIPYSIGAVFGRLVLTDKVYDEKTLIIDQEMITDSAVIRTGRSGDTIELRDGRKRVSELEKEYRIPFSIVLEDRNGIAAVFGRFLGGRDRLAARFLGHNGTPVSIECSL